MLVLADGALRPLGEVLNHPGHSSQKSHGRRRAERVAELRQGPAPTVLLAARGTNPRYGSSVDGPTYRDAGRAGKNWDPSMGPPPSGAFEENCTNAVMAFEMRMRGFDVQAAPMGVLDKYGYAAGRSPGEIDDLVSRSWTAPGGKPHGRTFADQKWRDLSDVDREIKKTWPEGGRGFMHVGKHVFSVVKKDGKAEYVEAQYAATPSRSVTKLYKKEFAGQAKVIRLDDLEPADGIFEAVEVVEP